MEPSVEGEIFVPLTSSEDDKGTLDEPVAVTLKRDLKAIMRKCVHVMLPVRSNKALLHDWDLWGPLLLCVTMAILLHSRDSSGDEYRTHFIHVFLLVWGGAAVATINAQLLRGKLSFFQSVCTLGYCLLPLATALLVSRLLLTFLPAHSLLTFALRFIVIAVAMGWSTSASVGFLSDYLPSDRRALAVYPIVLFYLCISCLIIAQTSPLV